MVATVLGGGFCSIRSLATACRRRVAPLLVQFPPFAGGEVAVRGGETPKVQTASAENADYGWCGRGGLWRCGHNDAWPRASLAHKPAITCTNQLYRTSTRYVECGRGCPGAHEPVNAPMRGVTCASQVHSSRSGWIVSTRLPLSTTQIRHRPGPPRHHPTPPTEPSATAPPRRGRVGAAVQHSGQRQSAKTLTGR